MCTRCFWGKKTHGLEQTSWLLGWFHWVLGQTSHPCRTWVPLFFCSSVSDSPASGKPRSWNQMIGLRGKNRKRCSLSPRKKGVLPSIFPSNSGMKSGTVPWFGFYAASEHLSVYHVLQTLSISEGEHPCRFFYRRSDFSCCCFILDDLQETIVLPCKKWSSCFFPPKDVLGCQQLRDVRIEGIPAKRNVWKMSGCASSVCLSLLGFNGDIVGYTCMYKQL